MLIRLALVLTLLFGACRAEAAITLVGTPAGTYNNCGGCTSVAASSYTIQNAGDLLLAFVYYCPGTACANTTAITPSITDTSGTSTAGRCALVTANGTLATGVTTASAILRCYNMAASGADTVTIGFSANVTNVGIVLAEYSGALKTGAPEEVAQSTSSNVATTSPSIATTGSTSGKDLVGATIPGTPTGFGQTQVLASWGAEYTVQSAAGTQTMSWTQSSGNYSAAVAAFKAITCAGRLSTLGVGC